MLVLTGRGAALVKTSACIASRFWSPLPPPKLISGFFGPFRRLFHLGSIKASQKKGKTALTAYRGLRISKHGQPAAAATKHPSDSPNVRSPLQVRTPNLARHGHIKQGHKCFFLKASRRRVMCRFLAFFWACFQELSGDPNTQYFLNTNGRRTAVQMGGVLLGFPCLKA